MDQGTRAETLGRLAEAVGSVAVAHPARVAIDGPPATGKTTLNPVLLDPLGPGGRSTLPTRGLRPHHGYCAVPAGLHCPRRRRAGFMGVFLMRPELIDRWDLRSFVSTALETTCDRAVIRERRVLSRAEVERRWRERHIPSRQFYFATVRPSHHADIIVHNDEPQQPVWETQTH